MNVESVLESIAQATINYIVVSSISSANQKQTVTDLKTDLRTTKEDLMAEMKDTRENILTQIENSTKAEIDVLKSNINEIKEIEGKKGN